MVLGILKRALHLWDQHVFMWKCMETFDCLQYFKCETNCEKKENVFQKAGVSSFNWKH